MAYAERGSAREKQGEFGKALGDYEEAIRLDPRDPWVHGEWAQVQATCPDARYRDGKRAIESATRACELAEWKDPVYLDTLAAACAEAGDFDAAVQWQTKSNAMVSDNKARTDGEARLKLDQSRTPYRETRP